MRLFAPADLAIRLSRAPPKPNRANSLVAAAMIRVRIPLGSRCQLAPFWRFRARGRFMASLEPQSAGNARAAWRPGLRTPIKAVSVELELLLQQCGHNPLTCERQVANARAERMR